MKFWNSLELHNSTQDVKDDIKLMNLKAHVKNKTFWALFVLVSGVSFIGAKNEAMSDPFRANMVNDANVSPAFSYFYDDHDAEKKVIEAVLDKKRAEVSAVKRWLGEKPKDIQYNINNFYADAKSGKIKLPFGMHMRKNLAYQEYQKNIYLSRLVQDANSTVSQGTKNYTYLQVSKKIGTLKEEDEKFRELIEPSKKILDKWGMFKSNDTIRELSKAIITLSRQPRSTINFLKELELEPKNAFSDIKAAMLNREYFYKFVNKKGSSYNIGMDTKWIQEEFKKVKAQKKKDCKKDLEAYESNKKVADKKEAALNIQIGKLNKGINLVHNLQTKVINYDKYASELEVVMTKLNKEGLVKWNN